MAEDRIVERRRVFKQYKDDVKTRGKPFYPFAMLHDTIMSLVVVIVIIVLAIIWKWTVPGDHASTASGWLGKLYDNPADPGTFSFVPRPDWYFYFLFYLLRIFKWPATVVLGTVGIPTIALILLISMPFIDLRAERRPLRRPVAMVAAVLVILSMGILTYKGATAKEALGSELHRPRPDLGEGAGIREQPEGRCRGEALRRRRLRLVPHLPRRRRQQPRRAGPVRRGRQEQGHRLPDRPPEMPLVREQRQPDALVRVAGRNEPRQAGGVPRGVEGPEVTTTRRALPRR